MERKVLGETEMQEMRILITTTEDLPSFYDEQAGIFGSFGGKCRSIIFSKCSIISDVCLNKSDSNFQFEKRSGQTDWMGSGNTAWGMGGGGNTGWGQGIIHNEFLSSQLVQIEQLPQIE